MTDGAASPSAARLSDRLLGAWHLVDCELIFSDGRPAVQPYGPDGRGLIIYSPEGWMSATLSRADRAPLSVGSLEWAHRAHAAARAAAFDGYLAYAGRWRVEGDEVVHSVELSLVPDAVGAEQRRRVTFDGEELELSYSLTARSGVVRRYRLRWRRAGGGPAAGPEEPPNA